MSESLITPASRAANARAALGLSDTAPVDLVKALRHGSRGLSVAFRQMSSSISGMCLRHGVYQLIVVNSAKSLGHQRFTMAHEYYHLAYEDGLEGRACSVGDRDARGAEREADVFASALLMPVGGIVDRLARKTGSEHPNLSIADVIDLEQYFGVSHAAMLIRLVEHRFITPHQAESFRLKVIEVARMLGQDIGLYRPTNADAVLSPYAEMAAKALESGLITPGKYEQLMLEGGLAELLYGGEEDETTSEEP